MGRGCRPEVDQQHLEPNISADNAVHCVTFTCKFLLFKSSKMNLEANMSKRRGWQSRELSTSFLFKFLNRWTMVPKDPVNSKEYVNPTEY